MNQNLSGVLWCLPYDQDSVTKQFLEISFSKYINNIISNKHFASYEKAMAKQLKDEIQWNEKCWQLLQFFEFLNQSFEMSKWDNYIFFQQDDKIRSTMGFFRLWIDTQRLYLFNFLKLDSSEFQDDRIFMALYRTLNYLHALFKQHPFRDFQIEFLNKFTKEAISQLQKLSLNCSFDISKIIHLIIGMLQKFRQKQKKQKNLVDPKQLNSLKKQAIVKVSKQNDIIKGVEMRLKTSVQYVRKKDEQLMFKTIAKSNLVNEIQGSNRKFYDKIYQIKEDYDTDQFFKNNEQKEKRKQQVIKYQIQKYKAEVKGQKLPHNLQIYQQLDKNDNNPYSSKNYMIYGTATKIDMDKIDKYKQQNKIQIQSLEDQDRSKFYHNQDFIDSLEKIDKDMGRVTQKDLRTDGTLYSKQSNDQKTRIFNLKWPRQAISKRTHVQQDLSAKDYDNNLLFKSPLQEQLLAHTKNNLDQLKEKHGTQTYTIALLQQMAEQIHGDENIGSSGSNYFVKNIPRYLDLNKFQTVNYNKFDFMRKVVGYITAQKKIKNIIDEKGAPDKYQRYYSDVHQPSYNPQLQYNKIRYAQGLIQQKPALYL